MNVVAVNDDVADIDADPEVDAPIGRLGEVSLRHPLLHLDGTAHGIHDTRELNKHAVADSLH
jgi:hypothetical protein